METFLISNREEIGSMRSNIKYVALAIGEFTDSEKKLLEKEIKIRKAKIEWRAMIPFNRVMKGYGFLIFSEKFYLSMRGLVNFLANSDNLTKKWIFVVVGAETSNIEPRQKIYKIRYCEKNKTFVGPLALKK